MVDETSKEIAYKIRKIGFAIRSILGGKACLLLWHFSKSFCSKFSRNFPPHGANGIHNMHIRSNFSYYETLSSIEKSDCQYRRYWLIYITSILVHLIIRKTFLLTKRKLPDFLNRATLKEFHHVNSVTMKSY